MIYAFTMAFYQLGKKSLNRVVWIALIGSVSLFFLLWLVVGFVLFETEFITFGGFFNRAFEWISDVFGVALVFVFSWFLFPSVVSLLVSFFLDDVARIIERDHFPELSKPRVQNIREVCTVTVKFSILVLALNILVSPIYAILFFMAGPVSILIFYALNGYLIGREFFELVAHRRTDPDQARQMRRMFRGQVFLAGLVIVFMMTLPIINLIAPVVATAAMVFLVENWRNKFEAA